MNQLYRGKYLKVDALDPPNNQYLKAYWQDNNFKMSDEEYKFEISHLTKIVYTLKPKGLVGGMQNFHFTISPKIQEWLNKNLFKAYIDVGVDKLAMVNSPDLFAQVSIEQTVDEEKSQSFRTRYFGDEDSAILWLNSELKIYQNN